MTRVPFRRAAVPEPSRVRGRGRVLWPGVLMPLVGFLGAAGLYSGVVLVVLHPGAQNHSLGFRMGAEIPAVMTWGLYKLGSQRITLDDNEMRITTWGLCWRVPRGAVRGVELRMRDQLSLVITLADGYKIRPTTFLARQGIGYGDPSAMSRAVIRDMILEWNEGGPAGAVTPAGAGRRGRYWRVRRDDLPVLAVMCLGVAVEAVVATRLGIW
jgi:hypothetical protein